jgi:N6-L-threonylcarbamoyladenine synthase
MSDITKTILAIETSCDETAAAVLIGRVNSQEPDFKFLSSVVRSQIEIHAKTGGVIPEVAARNHMENIRPVVEKALNDAKLKIDDIDYVAVTAGPGLIVALIVGVEFAKALALGANKPIVPVNHMAGHLYSVFGGIRQEAIGNRKDMSMFPILSMIVSGGHTLLVVMTDYDNYKVIGSTVDDAAGEAFDKVAKLMGLPYPGGPEIGKLAAKFKTSEHEGLRFPRPMIGQDNYDFSFSGLKTAVRNYIKDLNQPLDENKKVEIAFEFEEAACDVLTTKAMRACEEYGCKTVSLSGGVAADKILRAKLKGECEKRNIEFIVPDFELCTDNAQMIAIAAYFKIRSGYEPGDPVELEADPNWEI